MTIRNYATRTAALTMLESMNIGESILLAPYNTGAYQQESSSLKAVACKKGFKVELKKALIVIEDEIPQSFLRVTRGGVDNKVLTPKDFRTMQRDEAIALMEQAEAALMALVESYATELDGKFSACHPRSGLSNNLNQMQKMRKAIKSAKL